MEQKPKQVWILIIIWIIIGILFIGMFINETSTYFGNLKFYEDSTFFTGNQANQFSTDLTFIYVVMVIFDILIIIFSFLLVYTSFYVKKWTWILGIILSSALLYTVYFGIIGVGRAIINGQLLEYFSNFIAVVYTIIIFIIPCTIYLLTRPTVRKYFEKI